MAADVLSILIRTNLAAAAAVLAALSLRKPLRRLFGARTAYALWLVVPLAAAAVLMPARAVVLPYAHGPQTMADIVVSSSPAPLTAAPVQAAALSDGGALVALWLAGAVISLGLLAWSQVRFMQSLGGVNREGRFLRARAPGPGPAVVGAFFPRIVLPADFEARYDAAEQEAVLAHEAAHLAAGDAVVNAVIALVQCLCWFNPLIHLAARFVRVDQELACDAAVLSAHPQMRRPYAEALLKTQIAAAPLPLGCYWPAGAPNPLKERIAMLKLPTQSAARKFAGAASVLALCLGAGATAWAAQPATVTLAPRPAADAAPPHPAVANARPAAAATQTAQAATRPEPADAAVHPASVQPPVDTAPSAAGNAYQRINPDLTPARASLFSVTMPDGRQEAPATPWIVPGVLAAEETEAYRAARRVYEAAREEHAVRAAYGRPPQPMTPELQSAIDTLNQFAQGLNARRTAAQEAYYETITATAVEGGVPSVIAGGRPAAAWPLTASYKVPRHFTTAAKTMSLASLDSLIDDAPPRKRELLAKIREFVAQKPTTN